MFFLNFITLSLPMAKTIEKSNQSYQTFCVLWLYMFMSSVLKVSSAFEYKVGGQYGWTIPNDLNELDYNKWAEKNRFRIGDTLVFDYPANKDTVVQVIKEDYNNCHSATPVKIFTDGHTIFKFNQSGPYYFISGLKENCFKNEKVVVVVIASNRSKKNITAPSPSPGSTEALVPSSTPSVEDTKPPRSSAYSVAANLIGSIAALTLALFPFVF